jgi:hypothetical protein
MTKSNRVASKDAEDGLSVKVAIVTGGTQKETVNLRLGNADLRFM